MAQWPLVSLAQNVSSDTVRVFYLGGQSNMDGYGYNKDLPKELLNKNEEVWIFHGNPVGDDLPDGGLGLWAPLLPGHGAGFSSDGHSNQLSDRFGVELTLAQRLQELCEGERIALVKYSRGGSSIDSLAAGRFGCWDPDFNGTTGMNQYDFFLRTVKQAMGTHDINGDGRNDVLVPAGIVWMQGESDASFTEELAASYYSNLKRLMDLIRAAFHTDDLPVVLGKISDSWNDEADSKVWNHGELVQYAQEKYARTDGFAAIVRSTRYYKYSDPWHYDSEGYIDLGKQFAEALYQLNH
ncbi:MAG: hypothetical protein E4H10_06790 [Bacteroidia bacterium]|nr:MAG: hypothetical protein E4H10_06790 [Bacteroidia bacterium]